MCDCELLVRWSNTKHRLAKNNAVFQLNKIAPYHHFEGATYIYLLFLCSLCSKVQSIDSAQRRRGTHGSYNWQSWSRRFFGLVCLVWTKNVYVKLALFFANNHYQRQRTIQGVFNKKNRHSNYGLLHNVYNYFTSFCHSVLGCASFPSIAFTSYRIVFQCINIY